MRRHAENLTPDFLKRSNASSNILGYIHCIHSERLYQQPETAFVQSCFNPSDRPLLQEIGEDSISCSPSLQNWFRCAHQREACTKFALLCPQKCIGNAIIVRI